MKRLLLFFPLIILGCNKSQTEWHSAKPEEQWRKNSVEAKCNETPDKKIVVDGLEINCAAYTSWYNMQILIRRDHEEAWCRDNAFKCVPTLPAK